MHVDMAVKARDTPVRKLRAPVLGLIELLLREWSDKQPKPLELLGIQDAVEELILIHDGDDLPLRHISKVQPGC